MTATVVLQSHALAQPEGWIGECIASVVHWAKASGFDYLRIGDELFDFVPADLRAKTATRRVVATDLARLVAAQTLLAERYETVVWCDADFLVFAPGLFHLPPANYALGREVWVEPHASKRRKFIARKQVHNAFLMFRRGNTFLDFYAETAAGMLRRISGPMPPQFIGPKLLTAMHNVVGFPILETAGMLSPAVIGEIAGTPGAAISLFRRRSPQPLAAANLCSSLHARGEFSEVTVGRCIDRLLARQAV